MASRDDAPTPLSYYRCTIALNVSRSYCVDECLPSKNLIVIREVRKQTVSPILIVPGVAHELKTREEARSIQLVHGFVEGGEVKSNTSEMPPGGSAEAVPRAIRDGGGRRGCGQKLDEIKQIVNSNILDALVRNRANDEVILRQILARKIARKVWVRIRRAPATRVPEIAQ